MDNNKGLSVIELVIVVFIIGIAITLAASSISTIFSLDVKSCAGELNALIAKCRVNSIARAGDVYIKIYKNNTSIVVEYYENDVLVSSENIGKEKLNIYYTDSDNYEHQITKVDPLYISFDRSTGGLLDLGTSATLADPSALSNSLFCTSITVMNSVRKLYVILIPSTGKHYVSA